MLLVGDQPYRYGSARLAKSRVMFMVMKGPTIPDPTLHRWHVVCFGNRSHYQRDTGVCCHVEILSERISDWHRARTWFKPFGNRDAEEVKLQPRVPGDRQAVAADGRRDGQWLV